MISHKDLGLLAFVWWELLAEPGDMSERRRLSIVGSRQNQIRFTFYTSAANSAPTLVAWPKCRAEIRFFMTTL